MDDWPDAELLRRWWSFPDPVRLAAAGVPVTAPVATTGGARSVEYRGRSYWVYRELPGAPVPQCPSTADAATRAGWGLVGRATAALQVALRRIDPGGAGRHGVPTRRPGAATARAEGR